MYAVTFFKKIMSLLFRSISPSSARIVYSFPFKSLDVYFISLIIFELLKFSSIGSIFLGNPSLDQHLERAGMGEGLLTFLVNLITELQATCYAVGEAIAVRENVNAPRQVMQERVKALEGIMGIIGVDTGEDTEMYPKAIADMILSNSVRIKK